ncbi:transposon TX1 uncharacterized 149 kDa protein [Trichonephila clavata]|uniref:Transposon TX1 uncharacterized 149 kDa protein n=1 Tax=Trichonephila clavata TaxID=2740835 RepID=A0A8X6L4T3_TRICU|nr:transposon TX1 uncharacterized 149 kDa protein [Trichonephila clavata]
MAFNGKKTFQRSTGEANGRVASLSTVLSPSLPLTVKPKTNLRFPDKQTNGHEDSSDDDVGEIRIRVKDCTSASLPPTSSGVDLINDQIRYTFPLPQVIKCPDLKCSHSFHTKKWYTTNTSLKRHLTSFHRKRNLSVQYWCAACLKKITQPAKHPCLKDAPLLVPSNEGEWQCEDCSFKATSKVGLDNHAKAHRRQVAIQALPPLSIPTSSKNKKKRRKKKLNPISSGTLVNQDVDELSEQFEHFENLVEGVVSTTQEFFKLARPTQENQRTQVNQSGPDVMNPQRSKGGTVGTVKVWETPNSACTLTPVNIPDRPPVSEALSEDFVVECLKSCENTAPGPDLISYKHWQEIDPRCKILTKIFNICIKLSDIRRRWKCSNTILIQKSSEPSSLNDWRPISLSDTAYKLFSKCLAKKLSDWCETYEVLSPAQKGFSPFDGVIEHNFILSEHMEAARRDKCECFVAWLDIANAFGSIPHGVILESLQNNGVDQDFTRLVQHIYTDAETRVLTEEGPTEPISLKSGVKQGCPLSGIWFNLAIVCVLHALQDQQEFRSVLVFADHLVLLPRSTQDLQMLMDRAFELLQKLKLQVHPHKCASLHLSGVTPVGSRDTVFTIGSATLKYLRDAEAYTYLGKPVGFFLQKKFSDANEARRLADMIAKSHPFAVAKARCFENFLFPVVELRHAHQPT